jgi:hypothetical protein
MCTDVNHCMMFWKVFHVIATLLAIGLLATGILMVCNPVAGCPGCGASDDYCCVSSKQLCDGCFCTAMSSSGSADSSDWWCRDTSRATIPLVCGGVLLGVELLGWLWYCVKKRGATAPVAVAAPTDLDYLLNTA